MNENKEKQLTLGQKIELFRKRLGVSQFDLEMEANISIGSISRIESGAVNPSKETLVKIIESLNLNSLEIASIFSINPADLADLMKITQKLNSTLNIEEILQHSVNEITYKLQNLVEKFEKH